MPYPIRKRADILAHDDRPTEVVDVPEWETALQLRGLSLAQLTNTRERARRDGEIDNMRANIFTFIEGVVEPRFDMADYDALREKSAGVVIRVASRIMELSGMGQGAVDTAVKNSDPTKVSDSGTS